MENIRVHISTDNVVYVAGVNCMYDIVSNCFGKKINDRKYTFNKGRHDYMVQRDNMFCDCECNAG